MVKVVGGGSRGCGVGSIAVEVRRLQHDKHRRDIEEKKGGRMRPR